MELPLRIKSDDESDVEITFPNDVTEGLQLVHVEANQYRLESSSIFADLNVFFGDVIEIRLTGQQSGLFQCIVRRSGFKVFQHLLSQKIVDSRELPILLDRVMQLGGNWERFFGGILLVHLPQEAELDIMAELQEIARVL